MIPEAHHGSHNMTSCSFVFMEFPIYTFYMELLFFSTSFADSSRLIEDTSKNQNTLCDRLRKDRDQLRSVFLYPMSAHFMFLKISEAALHCSWSLWTNYCDTTTSHATRIDIYKTLFLLDYCPCTQMIDKRPKVGFMLMLSIRRNQSASTRFLIRSLISRKKKEWNKANKRERNMKT